MSKLLKKTLDENQKIVYIDVMIYDYQILTNEGASFQAQIKLGGEVIHEIDSDQLAEMTEDGYIESVRDTTGIASYLADNDVIELNDEVEIEEE